MLYDWKCDCGHVMTETGYRQWPDVPRCPKCHEGMYRDYGGVQTGGHEYKKPLHSDSLAIAPSQVTEHKQKFPGIELDSECRPVFHNVSEHDAYLNAIGAYKAPQKTGRSR
jgi:hypothetical protein